MKKMKAEYVLEQFDWSLHAQQRQQQRGFQGVDENLLKTFGEKVHDGYVMTNRSITDAQRALKKMLQRLDHLNGATLIESEGTVVTVFRADKKRMRRLKAGHVEAA